MIATKEKAKNMGRVIVSIKVANTIDNADAKRGYIKPENIRNIEIDALVDTGAGLLCLDPELIKKLGLDHLKDITVDTAEGPRKVKLFRNAILTILERSCPIDVVEIHSKNKALVGYLPLEALDLVVDPKAQKVIPNPEHGDEMILDLL